MFTRWRLFVRDWCMQWWQQPVGTQGDNSQKQMQQEFIAIVLEIHKWISLITESFAFWLNLKRPNRNTACFLTRYLYSAMHIQCHQLQVGSRTVSTLHLEEMLFQKLKMIRSPACVCVKAAPRVQVEHKLTAWKTKCIKICRWKVKPMQKRLKPAFSLWVSFLEALRIRTVCGKKSP